MRSPIQEEAHIFDKLYKKIAQMDLLDTTRSLLINGGPGLGKSFACLSPQMYDLFSVKLEKENPRILLVKSRALDKEQAKIKNENNNLTILQFKAVAHRVDTLNQDYDLIIIDEAHSLFTDAPFAADATSPLLEWIEHECAIPQIYITASDVDFIHFAELYFTKKEFDLVFSDLDELHYYHRADTMVLSINSMGANRVIPRRESEFFVKRRKGLFFTLDAKDAYQLSEYYNEKGYRCAFYVSKGNSTQIAQLKSPPEEVEDIFQLVDDKVVVSVLGSFRLQEKARRAAGLETVEAALRKERLPADIDYLFITDVGQEGISLAKETGLEFMFIEDYYPLKIDQKMVRYRGDLPFVYVSLARQRILRLYQNTIKFIDEVKHWSQDMMRGFYLGAKKGKSAYRSLIVQNREGTYEIAKNAEIVIRYLNEQSKILLEQTDPEKGINEEYLREQYGQNVKNFYIEDSKMEGLRDNLREVLQKWNKIPLNDTNKEIFCQECKDAGLRREDKSVNFKFSKCKILLEEMNLAQFKQKNRASKKDVEHYPYLEERQRFWYFEL